MAFTIKERAFYLANPNEPNPTKIDPRFPQSEMTAPPPRSYYPAENILGPFTSVTQSYQDGYLVITGHTDDLSPGHSFGPWSGLDEDCPRPTVWVMNDAGATVAKYDL